VRWAGYALGGAVSGCPEACTQVAFWLAARRLDGGGRLLAQE